MTKKKIFRYLSLVMTMIIMISAISFETYAFSVSGASHWGYAKYNLTVYNADGTVKDNALVYGREGFTIIKEDFSPNGHPWCEIEYSSSSGKKTGFVYSTGVLSDTTHSTVAIVTTSTYVWYSYETAYYPTIGSVSSGENVCILAKNGSYSYIEYNTTSGRKRGWCLTSCLNELGNITGPNMGTTYHMYNLSGNTDYDALFYYHTVYAGPGAAYAVTGSIGTTSSQEAVHVIAKYTLAGETWYYITYYANALGKYKSGYIKE